MSFFCYFIPRPVVAIIEVEVYRVSRDKRARIRDEVAASLGPPDPTVLVQEKEEGASVNIPQLLETFRKFGDVVLVRVTDDAILVTFKKSTSAVTATAVKEVSLCVSYLQKFQSLRQDLVVQCHLLLPLIAVAIMLVMLQCISWIIFGTIIHRIYKTSTVFVLI